MRKREWFIAVVVAAGALALAAGSSAVASTRGGLASASSSTVTPSPAALAAVRDHVEQWLGAAGFSGFRVSEVMAFTNNSYVAVNDRNGKPAFELIAAPGNSWLMEEPASMMWNTRYGMLANTDGTVEPIRGMSMMWGGGMMGSSSDGMMGSPSNWYSRGTGKVTSLQQAVKVADKWLTKARPGGKAEMDGRAYPGYFTLDTTLGGKTAGMLSVNALTGAVWYHGWHGTFLSERMF